MKFLIAALFMLTAAEAQGSKFDHSHAAFDSILKKYVTLKGSESRVKYRELKFDRAGLDTYITTLEAVKKEDYDKWKTEEKLAFLINAYNALTLQLILNHHPVESIKKIGGIFSSPWKKEFFTLFGEKRHLDHIEHKILRVDFDEPRIHFAIVCASVGCPALQPEAFTPKKLNAQLEAATKLFLRDPGRNLFDAASGTLTLSKIFEWFGDDFKKKSGTQAAFVAPYMTDDKALQEKIKATKDFETFDYSWKLNEAI